MKKTVLAFIALFVGSFLLITWFKSRSTPESVTPTESTLTKGEKEKVIQFWSLYKEATGFRLEEKWDQAAEKYKEALLLNKVHEDAWYYLGNMHLELNQFPEAEKCWLQLIHIHPKNSRAYMQLADLYISTDILFDLDKAEKACQESLAINKEETGPVQLLGEVYLIRGDLDEAANLFASVAASNYKSIDSYFLRGYIDWKKGQPGKALDWYKQAITYAQPTEHVADKVLGEGDTKNGKGFGSVTSKSVFQPLLNHLSTIPEQNIAIEMEKQYRELRTLLADLKRKIH